MTAKIYTDDKGRLVFQGFTCDNCVITGGDILTNYLFGEFLAFADIYLPDIPPVVVIDCKFLGDNWISRTMTRLSGGQVRVM